VTGKYRKETGTCFYTGIPIWKLGLLHVHPHMEMGIPHFHMGIRISPFPYGDPCFHMGIVSFAYPYGKGDSPFPYGDWSIPISIQGIPVSIWGSECYVPRMETGIPHFCMGICQSPFPYGESPFSYGECCIRIPLWKRGFPVSKWGFVNPHFYMVIPVSIWGSLNSHPRMETGILRFHMGIPESILS
jgi:hypothetical protein